MPRRGRTKSYPGKKGSVAASQPLAAPRDAGAAMAALVLATVLALTGLLVDSGADASFDAPKRLVALAGAVAACLFAFGFSRWGNPLADSGRAARGAPLFLLAAVLWGLAAAVVSPRQIPSLDSTRALLLTALFLPLGASRVIARSRTPLLGAFLAVAAVNAIVSILQARGLFQPFALLTVGSRDVTGAFVGNVGYLALNLALAAVAALAAALMSRSAAVRVLCLAGAILFAGALLINRNLTALTALVAGSAILSIGLYRRRAFLPIAGLIVLLGTGMTFYPPMHARLGDAVSAVRRGDWDRLVSYRLGAWATAVEMAGERPLAGWGPGTFGAEFVPHRLKAEVAMRRRFVNILLSSSYGEAHNDYLQPFAEAGIPAGLALLAAAILLFVGLLRAVREDSPRRREAVFLLALLGAGATAALTWFPLQRPITAVPLLLAAGRAWKISHTGGDGSPEPKKGLRRNRGRVARGLALAVLLAALLLPEAARYRSERMLRPATEALRAIGNRPQEVADRVGALDRAGGVAESAARGLPGDPRPWILSGLARLRAGKPERAAELFRTALSQGERAETDLHLGSAYGTLGDRERASIAIFRAVWVSPALLQALPLESAQPLANEVWRLEAELRAGNLKEPPALPD